MIPARVLCLDWDKRSLRFVSARVARRSVKLDDAHSHRLPPDIDADKPDALGEFIKQTLARHRVGQKRVIVDVPRDQAVINRLRVPPTPDTELAAAVQFQAQRELPFSVEIRRTRWPVSLSTHSEGSWSAGIEARGSTGAGVWA